MDFLPYSRPLVEDDDIRAVSDSLQNPMISQGDRLAEFEKAFAAFVDSRFAVAFSSGTAALHAMCATAGIGPGDQVLVPALTFAGTANAILYCGATPVFVDVNPDTFCIDCETVSQKLSEKCRALLSVDFAGQPVEYDKLRKLANDSNLLFLSDAAHAPGARYGGKKVGSLADMTAFSFNPVKNMTSAEGGMVATNNREYAERLRMFVVHGMTRDAAQLVNPSPGGWYYEQQFLGMNYKISEPHAALGLSQLKKLPRFNKRRAQIAATYRSRLAHLPIMLPSARRDAEHVYHLFVIRLLPDVSISRDAIFERLRREGIGVQVHYIPIPQHPYYHSLGYRMEGLDETVSYYSKAMSIPVHPAMTDADLDRVVDALDRHLA